MLTVIIIIIIIIISEYEFCMCSNNDLGGEGAGHIATGCWPKLDKLNIGYVLHDLSSVL